MHLVTESRIDGSFYGWGDPGVFKLVNGQIWEQTHYKYHYHYAYRPVARIFKDGSRHYLEVQGMNEVIEVRRVR